MKKLYTEPELEITRFSFSAKVMTDNLAWHSALESGGTGGTIYEGSEDEDDIGNAG